MPKKHKHEEHENHERWLVSYADFITLLFAFFVVMYSISSVNEGKFRVVSQSIVEALNPMINLSASNIKITPEATGGPNSTRAISIDMMLYRRLSDAVKASEAAHKAMTGRMQRAEADNAGATPLDAVSVAQEERGVVVSLANAVAFEPGRAEILPEARETLARVAAVLQDFPHQVRVEGHTDNVPIHTELYPSNWELSTARAVTITRFLSEGGYLPPARLAAGGYGEFHPVATNDTPAGRAQNRRVELVVIKSTSPEGALHATPDVVIGIPCAASTGLPGSCRPDAPPAPEEIVRRLF